MKNKIQILMLLGIITVQVVTIRKQLAALRESEQHVSESY